jgi:prepilin-type N-terminal cleavage/methylation domain-containing protein
MKAKGFTLIELATVLAIIAVLAAVLTPVVLNYVDQARVTRAQGDTKSIAESLRLYQRDVGEFPVFDSITEAGADAVGNDGVFLAGPGATPSDSVGGTPWSTGVSTTTLTNYVNNNYLNRATSAAVGKVQFRGPYIGQLDSDPWGNRYYVTAQNLQDSVSGVIRWAFAISAGPNGALETSPTQLHSAAFATGGDDVVSIIR